MPAAVKKGEDMQAAVSVGGREGDTRVRGVKREGKHEEGFAEYDGITVVARGKQCRVS